MANIPFTVKDAFQAGQVQTLLRVVSDLVRKVEADFASFNEAEFSNLRDSINSFADANFKQLLDNFIQIEFVHKRGIAPSAVPPIFDATRMRYVTNWRQAVTKGFATAIDSAKGLQQKIQRELLAEIRAERQRRVLAIQKGILTTPKPRGFLNLLLRIFGFQRASRDKMRKVSMGLVAYLRMLFRTLPRDMERDLMRFLIRFFENNTFLVVGGVVHNSASTCIYANGRVFTQEALTFITESPQLKVHLFHPNCRHRIVPPPKNFDGKVIGVDDLPAVVKGHFHGYHK